MPPRLHHGMVMIRVIAEINDLSLIFDEISCFPSCAAGEMALMTFSSCFLCLVFPPSTHLRSGAHLEISLLRSDLTLSRSAILLLYCRRSRPMLSLPFLVCLYSTFL